MSKAIEVGARSGIYLPKSSVEMRQIMKNYFLWANEELPIETRTEVNRMIDNCFTILSQTIGSLELVVRRSQQEEEE